MDKRSEFLSKFWIRYPAVKENVLDVAAVINRPTLDTGNEILIGGRLFGTLGEFTISSGGVTCAIQFLKECRWLASNQLVDASVLSSGDIILVKAKAVGIFDSVVLQVSEVQLLAPSFTQAKHNSSVDVALITEWSSFLQNVRQYFFKSEFLECQTPTLVPAPGTEPYLDVFTTDFVYGKAKKTFYLPTSPEFHLKKLLARGATRIFEIRSCFRNGELSDHHQPEFQMLEWYRAYAGLDAIVEDIGGVLKHLQASYPQRKIENLKVTTMAELFAEQCNGFSLRPTTSREELFQLCSELNLHPADDDSWDDLFFRIVIEKIEPSLDPEVPTIVRNYPQPQAALARLAEDGWAQRFELYWRGLEIANAFDELNDPKQNEERFQADLKKREQSGRSAHPIDAELVQAFYSGMPPAGGIALGLERLFMALFEVQQIAAARPFSVASFES